MDSNIKIHGGDSDPSTAFDLVAPRADSVTEALRAVGYDLATAVADIVDNSISAGGSLISIQMEWDVAGPWIRVEDNGHGMSESEIVEAMRLGGRSPLIARDPNDLGRFGLGLKTASFSQCRRLTVRSRSAGEPPATRCWDLDVIRKTGDWTLLKSAPDSLTDELLGSFLDQSQGTVVLWQKFDRVTPDPSHPRAQARFLDWIAKVAEHLGMIFHRYLVGAKRIEIMLNGQPVEPWDPFMVAHAATQVLPNESIEINGNTVTIQPYVLPHESKLTEEEHLKAAGPSGWNASQGYYIYRNRRLLVAGGWFGQFQQEEHYKLARIRLDIPNSLDEDWQIDIRKASACPPAQARDHMLRIAKATRRQAKQVYGHRGAVLARRLAGGIIPVWRQIQHHGVSSFRLNRDHPLFARLLSGSDQTPKDFNASLSLIEETIPINLILAQFAENRSMQAAPFQGRETQLKPLLEAVMAALREQGLTAVEIRDRLIRMEPFSHHPEMVFAVLPGDVEQELKHG